MKRVAMALAAFQEVEEKHPEIVPFITAAREAVADIIGSVLLNADERMPYPENLIPKTCRKCHKGQLLQCHEVLIVPVVVCECGWRWTPMGSRLLKTHNCI
jgi:hypothetical protein